MSTFKNNLEISVFGESHSEIIGLTIHNFPSGVKLNIDHIKEALKLRCSNDIGLSKRKEEDKFEIVSGYFNEYTTGAPLTFIIHNNDIDSSLYYQNKDKMRPSHADYTAYKKYNGFNDFRGAGHLSGRLTALYMILGSICLDELSKRNIHIYSAIKQIGLIQDSTGVKDYTRLNNTMPVYDEHVKKEMIDYINKLDNDSVGGIISTDVVGIQAGYGNPIFDNVESIISHLIFSIPGVKGIEFGEGFKLASMLGSQANDQMQYINNEVVFKTNNSGGIQGGITNGAVISFNTVIKPTPSISMPLNTIDINLKKNVELSTIGRHDKCIAIKAVHVIKYLTAYAIYDLIQG